jgi:hypothetical protein
MHRNRPSPRSALRALVALPALAAALALFGGCAVVEVAGAAAGAAIDVTGAVVSTGVHVTGKVIEKTIDAASSDKKDGS